jgi:hypothetical protein
MTAFPQLIPDNPDAPINYHNLEPGDSIIFDTQLPVRDGTLGLITHVADNGIDAFILSKEHPSYASALTHERDPRLKDEGLRAQRVRRGVFRLTNATTRLRPLFWRVDAMKGEINRLQYRVGQLEKRLPGEEPDSQPEEPKEENR